MSIAVDILLVLVFASVLFFFARKGLDSAVERLGKIWLDIAFALIVSPILMQVFEAVLLRDLITDAVHGTLVDLIAHNANGYNLAELFENMPQNFVNLLDGLGASLATLEAEFGSYTEASDTILEEMAARIAAPCVKAVSSIVSFGLGILVPKIFRAWIRHELKKDSKRRFFRFLDRVDGLLVGVALGYLAVLGLSIVTRTVFQVIVAFDASIQVMPVYERSYIFKFLAEFDTFGAISDLIHTVSYTVDHLVH